MATTVDGLLHMAQLAEQAERYDDMVDYMKQLTKLQPAFSPERRNLLSVAYKNVVGERRSAWRCLSAIKEKSDETNGQDDMAAVYLEKIEAELKERCGDVLKLIDEHLLAKLSEEDGEAKVFYTKMKGDYNRYLVEVTSDEEREGLADKSFEAYDSASKAAEVKLKATHPIRLGLALNFSVFYYEIRNDAKEACKLAEKAFDTAMAEMDDLKEENYKDSTLILQLLRDNLTLWTSESETGEEEQ